MSKYVWNRQFSLPRGYTPPNTINYPFQPFNEGGINPALAQKWRSEPSELEYTHKDTILYALGIGAGPNKEPCELKYIYENHEDFMVMFLLIQIEFNQVFRLFRHSQLFPHSKPLASVTPPVWRLTWLMCYMVSNTSRFTSPSILMVAS